MPKYTFPTQKNVSGVYEIYCTANGKRYIGSAQCLRHRRNDHLHLLRTHQHHSIHLQRAWDKYGEAAFQFNILEFCDVGDLLQREQYYLDAFHPELNVAFDAASPMKGRNHTEETLRRLSEYASKQPRTEQHRFNIAKALFGRVRSEEERRNISKGTAERTPRGENVNFAKLTERDVIEIRARYARGRESSTKLAEIYGVYHSTILNIVHRKTWKHIP